MDLIFCKFKKVQKDYFLKLSKPERHEFNFFASFKKLKNIDFIFASLKNLKKHEFNFLQV